MTQTETPPDNPPGNCGKMRGKMCFVWMGLGFFMLILAGAATLEKHQWLIPATQTQPVADNGAFEQRIKILESRVDELSQKQPAPMAADNPETTESVKNLQAQVEALQKQNDSLQQSARKIAATALVFGELREAALKGQNFAAPLEHFKFLAGDDNAIAEQISKLAPYASNPPPGMPQLKALLSAEDTASQPEQGENLTLRDRLENILRPLISVRPAHNPQFDNLEAALDKGDAEAASAAFKTLPQDSRKKLEILRTDLDAHIAIDDALNSIQKILEGG